MPLPAVILAAGSVIGFFVLEEIRQDAMQQIGKVAAQQALEGLGIPLDLDGEVSQETITQAINEGILGGEMQFRNLFDRGVVEADLKRIAIERAGQAFGFEGGLSIEGIREKLVSQIISEVQENIASAGGEYIDAAQSLASIEDDMTRGKPRVDDWNKIKNFSDKAEKNRARQETYRNQHSRRWI